MERKLGKISGRSATLRGVSFGAGGTAGLLAVAHGVNDLFGSLFPALLPGIQARLDLSESTVALLVGTLAFSSSFLGPFLGSLSDRLGARLVMTLGLAFSAVFLSLIGAVSSLGLLFALLLVAGLGSAALHPAGSALARSEGGQRAGLVLGLFSAGGMIGYALGPLLVLFIVERFGIEATTWLMIPGLAAAGLFFALAPEGRRSEPLTRPQPFDRRLFTGPVGVLTIAGTLNALVGLTFVSAFPLWLVEERGMSTNDTLIGLTLGVFSVAAAAGGILAGLLCLRFRRELVVAGAMLLTIAPLLLLFRLEPGSALFFSAVALAGALSYASSPLMVLGAQDLAPRQVAAASGMLVGLAGGVAGLLYIGLGWLQETVGLGPVIGSTYLALLPAALLAYRILREVPATAGPSTSEVLDVVCACLGTAVCGTFGNGRVGPASAATRTSGSNIGCACPS